MLYFVIPALLFALSFLAGMMGLGVAFIATPILGLFGFDLKHVIMPWSLWLNGLTAIAGAITFARAKMVDWRTAIPLAHHYHHCRAFRRVAVEFCFDHFRLVDLCRCAVLPGIPHGFSTQAG